MAAPQVLGVRGVAAAGLSSRRCCPAAVKHPVLAALLVRPSPRHSLFDPSAGVCAADRTHFDPGTRSAPGCPNTRCRNAKAGVSPSIPEAEGEKDGGHDGETRTASQKEAPSSLLQASPKGDLDAMTPKGARGLTRHRAQGLPPPGPDGGGVAFPADEGL